MDFSELNINNELLNNSSENNKPIININFPDDIKINNYKTWRDYFYNFLFFACCVLFVVFLPVFLWLLFVFIMWINFSSFSF